MATIKLAVLKHAKLSGAHLEGADFSPGHYPTMEANPAGKEYILQKIKAVGLTDAQLLEAFGDGETKLPEGITRPKHWPPLQKQGD